MRLFEAAEEIVDGRCLRVNIPTHQEILQESNPSQVDIWIALHVLELAQNPRDPFQFWQDELVGYDVPSSYAQDWLAFHLVLKYMIDRVYGVEFHQNGLWTALVHKFTSDGYSDHIVTVSDSSQLMAACKALLVMVLYPESKG